MESSTIFLLSLGVFVLLLVVFLIWYIYNQQKAESDTQSAISDRELLLRLAAEPDGFLTPEGLSKSTQLTKREARSRLQILHSAGLLDQAYNSRLTTFYSLRQPLGLTEQVDLSPEPYLTVEDVLTLFERYDYRPRDQDLVLGTGLPLRLIRREMKYFAEQEVVDTLYISNHYGKHSQRTYVLKEPYRTQPDKFRGRAEHDNLELRTILRNDNFIV